MGHRTLLAYERDGYDLHYAHWGVAPDEITPVTPFGGPPDDDWARAFADDLLDPEGGRLTDDHRTVVESDPIATGLSFDDICSYVDPLEHEALYVVDTDFTVRPYLVVAVRAPGDDERRVVGALVGYEGERDASYLRGWIAGARAVRDTGAVDDDAVISALRWLDPERGTLLWLPEPEP